MFNDKINRRDFLEQGGKVIGSIAILPFLNMDITPDYVNDKKEIFSSTCKARYFQVMEGKNLNLLYQGEKLSSDIILSSKGKNRIIFAFLNGNSSFAIWFDENICKENSGLMLEPSGELKECITEEGITYISLNVTTNKKTLVITDYILDSVRAVRDKSESGDYKGLDRVVWRQKFADTKPPVTIPSGWVSPKVDIFKEKDGKTLIKLYRTDLYENVYIAGEILFPDDIKITRPNSLIQIERDSNITFQVKATSTFPNLTPFKTEELIKKEYLEKIQFPEQINMENKTLRSQLTEYGKYYQTSLRDLQFLSSKECYLAGSWRFLTYFGRDTMMTVMGLGKIMTSSAYESGMESVLERLSPAGKVAHEDNSWWQAEAERIIEYNKLVSENKRKEADEILKKLYDQNYDYKMVDDDFMFPSMLNFYLKRQDISDKGKKDFIHRINKSQVLNKETDNLLAIMRNFNKILSDVWPYYEVYKKFPEKKLYKEFSQEEKKLFMEKLIRIKKGSPVGDWRDSNAGMGGGVYSGNVNIYLVPAALKSIYSFLKSSYSDPGELKEIARHNNLGSLDYMLRSFNKGKSMEFESLIKSWEMAKELFRVKIDCQKLRDRINNFITSSSRENENFILSLPVAFKESCTIGDFIKGKTPEILKDGIEFFALSIDEALNPVEILNSDISFGLFLDELNEKEIEDAIKIASLNYPLGLMTGAGLLTANPSVSKDMELWKILNVGSYHGTVVWSWQMTLFIKGLLYQSSKSYSKEVIRKIYSLAEGLLKIENSLGDIKHFELWSIKPDITSGTFTPIPYGEGSETESNALQLWSTLSLSLLEPFNIF